MEWLQMFAAQKSKMIGSGEMMQEQLFICTYLLDTGTSCSSEQTWYEGSDEFFESTVKARGDCYRAVQRRRAIQDRPSEYQKSNGTSCTSTQINAADMAKADLTLGRVSSISTAVVVLVECQQIMAVMAVMVRLLHYPLLVCAKHAPGERVLDRSFDEGGGRGWELN